jgi:DNA-binding CsgD family transcriptional regulator
MAEIAGELNRSPRTVEQHILNMRTRFGCSNIGQLIAYGKDLDLV